MTLLSKSLWTMLLCTSCLLGQASRTATLVGTVVDPLGAMVANAKITLVNKDTSFVSNGETNTEGGYYIPFLAVGVYQLTVEAPGFKKFVESGLQLRAAEVPRIDVTLEVGSVSDSVQITASTPMLETETSLVSQTMEAKTLNELPVVQLKAHRVLYYMMGVQNRGADSSVVGQSQSQLGFMLDGISGKTSVRSAIGDTNTSVQPAMDALAEAKIYTTGTPADVGHAAGGMIAFTFKSGTNDLHGSFEDRYTNRVMTHRHFLEQLPRTNPFNYHQIMGTFSGPVVIPKLYNGKNKTFFLFGYGRHHEVGNDPQTSTVPDQNMLNGDFSFPQVAMGGFPIYDPSTYRMVGNAWVADPFPGNIIPQSRFDPAAVKFLSLTPWQAPNNPGGQQYTRTGPQNNWNGYTFYQSFRERFDIKFDHQISPSNKFFIRNSYNKHRQTGRVNAWVSNPVLDQSGFGYGRPNPIDQQNWAFADYQTFSSSLMNEVRVGFNRRVSIIDPPTVGAGWASQLGIPNVGGENFPTFILPPSTTNFYGVSPGSYSRDINEDFTIQNNLTKVAGRRTFKVGYEVIRTRENNIAQALPSGSYTFNAASTGLQGTANTGNGFASFLLGAVNSAAFTQLLTSSLPRWWTHAAYLQADLKVTSTLTVNVGLRYAYETPFQTKYGQKSQFDPNAIDPLTGRMGAITHPTGSVYKSDWNNFQPRLGLAWNFNRKMVFRGSWGLLTQDMLATGGNQEYTATANVQPLPGDPRPAFYLSQGPPDRNFTLAPDGTSPFVGTNYSGRNATYLDPNLRVPYVMNWSGGIQIELGGSWVHELLYQGSAGVGLTGTVNLNQLPQSLYESRDFTLLNQVRNAAQNYRRFPHFGTIDTISNYGHSTYHGLIARIEKRYSSTGLTFNTHYTWSKNLAGGAGDGWQYYNWSLTKARTDLDTRHRLVSTLQYELPVGRGRRFLNGGGITNQLLGGWNIVFIGTVLSGPPITFNYADSPNLYLPGGPSRPNQILPNDQVRVPDWDLGANRFPTSAQNPYYNMNAFGYPESFTQGSVGAGTQSGLWQIWPQWSLSKSWMLRERAKFSVRLDGNNLPVRRQFTNPNSAVNFVNPQNFGRFSPGGTSYSTLGTPNGQLILGGRVEF